MENIFYLKTIDTTIEDKKFYKICLLDMSHVQLFFIYKQIDAKSTNFVNSHKTFDNVSNELKFVIKRDNKISLDIK